MILISKNYIIRNPEIETTDEDIHKFLQMIKECNHFQIPFYRLDEPEKTFAEYHNIKMTEEDYKNILHTLTYDDFEAEIKSGNKNFLGNRLFEFIKNVNYTTINGDKIDCIEIYIKIEKHPNNKDFIAIISFHDPERGEEILPEA